MSVPKKFKTCSIYIERVPVMVPEVSLSVSLALSLGIAIL